MKPSYVENYYESQWPTKDPPLRWAKEMNLYASKVAKKNQRGQKCQIILQFTNRKNWNATPNLSKSK